MLVNNGATFLWRITHEHSAAISAANTDAVSKDIIKKNTV